MNILNKLDGHKTHLLVLVAAVLWLGLIFDLWTWGDINELFGLLTILGVGTFRDALRKLEK